MPRCNCSLNLGWSALECPAHELPTEVRAIRAPQPKRPYGWKLIPILKSTFVLPISTWPVREELPSTWK